MSRLVNKQEITTPTMSRNASLSLKAKRDTSPSKSLSPGRGGKRVGSN